MVPPSSCLDGGPQGWVPVDTHSTPVLTSVRRLWVAYAVYEPNTPQEHAQLAHGSGERVQDHEPRTSQPSQTTALRPLAQVMVAAEQTPRQSAAQQLSRPPPESASSEDDESSTPSMEQSEEAAPATPVSNNNKVLMRCWRMPRWSHLSGGGHSRGSYPRHTGERRGERQSHRNHSRSVSRIDTSELQRRRNSIRLPDLKRRSSTRTTRPSDTKPCHTSSGHPVFFHTSKHRD